MKKLLSVMFALMLMISPLSIFAAEKDIVDTAVGNGNFTILAQALDKAGLVDTLKGDGPFTVFAPTDDAFKALLTELDISAEELLAREDLGDILKYHVIADKVMASDLKEGMMAKTVNGKELTITLEGGAKVNGVAVATADVEASNGVIHIIDKVLLPPADKPAEDMKSIVDIAVGNKDFSILVQALTKAGLVDTLKGDGPFTVFAPTDAAFSALLKELNVTADQLLAREDLKDILLYHVVSGKVLSKDLTEGMMPKTVNGKTVTITLKDGAKVNDSKVTTADIEASNGVIHIIDKVLLPAANELPPTGVESIIPFAGSLVLGGAALLALRKRK